ncbi:MAG: hypothetical protein NT150_04930 [Bacteroidetes bacterium]|nr:hypothetical protein [Bacteroidota bacterium]
MKIKLKSLIAAGCCFALFSCTDDSVTYEQVLVNNTSETIDVMAGSGSCGEHTYSINPGEEKVVHTARLVQAPSSCTDHHYMVMSGPDNLNDITDLSNWRRIESKNLVRCEFNFEYTHDTDTAADQQ